eukprot:SAG11_NODE_7813_length_1093_cov_1.271630_2_plen_73_part_00
MTYPIFDTVVKLECSSHELRRLDAERRLGLAKALNKRLGSDSYTKDMAYDVLHKTITHSFCTPAGLQLIVAQ